MEGFIKSLLSICPSVFQLTIFLKKGALDSPEFLRDGR